MRLRSLGLMAAAFVSILVGSDMAGGAGTSKAGLYYSTGYYMLYVDNQPSGFLTQVAGGGAFADVVADRAGAAGQYPKKHVGVVRYQDIVFGINSIEKPIGDWMKATINTAQPQRRGGAFAVTDTNLTEISRTTWPGGVISDVTFPELDASSKDRAIIAVTVSPDRTTTGKSSAGKVDPSSSTMKGRKPFTGSSFRVTIPGIDASRISHVDPIGIRVKPAATNLGELRDYERTSGTVDVSNLGFVVSEAYAAPFRQWHDEFVVRGQNGDDKEKTVTIEALGSNGTDLIYRLTLRGVGIMKVGPDSTSTSNTDSIAKVRVEAYVESAALETPETPK